MVPVSKKPSAKIIHPKENNLSQCGWYNLFHSRYNTMLQVSHQWLEILRAREPISFPGSLFSDLKVAGRSVICPTTRTTGTRDPRDPGKQRSREPREPENHMNHENNKNHDSHRQELQKPQEPEHHKYQRATRTRERQEPEHHKNLKIYCQFCFLCSYWRHKNRNTLHVFL